MKHCPQTVWTTCWLLALQPRSRHQLHGAATAAADQGSISGKITRIQVVARLAIKAFSLTNSGISLQLFKMELQSNCSHWWYPEWWIESTASLGRLPVLSPFLAGNWDFHLLRQKVNKHRSAAELCCLPWQIWAWDFLLAYNQWKMDYSNQFFHQTS